MLIMVTMGRVDWDQSALSYQNREML